MDSNDLNKINVEFSAGLGRKYFIPYKEENMKVEKKRNTKRTHDEILARVTKSQVTVSTQFIFSAGAVRVTFKL
jgi:hypothetical protein